MIWPKLDQRRRPKCGSPWDLMIELELISAQSPAEDPILHVWLVPCHACSITTCITFDLTSTMHRRCQSCSKLARDAAAAAATSTTVTRRSSIHLRSSSSHHHATAAGWIDRRRRLPPAAGLEQPGLPPGRQPLGSLLTTRAAMAGGAQQPGFDFIVVAWEGRHREATSSN